MVIRIHLFTFQRRSIKAGHRKDRLCRQPENQHWESAVSEQVSILQWVLLKKAQLASVAWADYCKGTPSFFFLSLLLPWLVPDLKIAFFSTKDSKDTLAKIYPKIFSQLALVIWKILANITILPSHCKWKYKLMKVKWIIRTSRNAIWD